MDIGIRFPSEADVIAEEAARFRALTPEARLRSIRGIINAGARMMRSAPKADFLREHAAEQKQLSRAAVQEFIARHGR